MAKTTRQSNIELLRICSILGVILLHYNNETMGGAFAFTQNLPINYAICVAFEAIAVCAVNVFILISGYFLVDSESRNITKVIELLFQVVLIKVGITILSSILHHSFSIKDFLKALVPNNYFVVIYIALYLISPLVNVGLKKISIASRKKILIVSILLLSVWPFLVDLFNEYTNNNWRGLSTVGVDGSSAGYTLVNFALMYLVGAYIRLAEDNIKVKTKRLVIIFVAIVAVIIAGYYFIGRTMLNYDSPIVVAEAAIVFLIFKNINIGYKKWINALAKSTFICFLTHTYLLKYINIERFSTANPIVQFFHMVLSTAIIYLICWLLYKLYNLVFGKLFGKLSSNSKMKISFGE